MSEFSMPLSELVMAYELRQSDCSWKRIALGLGRDWKLLKDWIRNLELGGLSNNHRKIPAESVATAIELRGHGLGWQSIADYLKVDRDSLRWAVHREQHKPY